MRITFCHEEARLEEHMPTTLFVEGNNFIPEPPLCVLGTDAHQRRQDPQTCRGQFGATNGGCNKRRHLGRPEQMTELKKQRHTCRLNLRPSISDKCHGHGRVLITGMILFLRLKKSTSREAFFDGLAKKNTEIQQPHMATTNVAETNL